jgi:hypothetical protein
MHRRTNAVIYRRHAVYICEVESSDNDAEKVSLNRGRDAVEASDKRADRRGGDAMRRSREIPSPWKPENARARYNCVQK